MNPQSGRGVADVAAGDVVEHWRFRRFGRWFFALALAAVVLAMGIDVLLNDPTGAPFPALTAFVYAVGYYFAAHRPSVTLYPDRLIVRNPFRAHVVPLANLQRVDTGYSGLQLMLRDGTQVQAWVLQKSNAFALLGALTRAAWAKTRADRAAMAIRERAGLPDPEAEQAEREARRREGRDFFDDVPRPRRRWGWRDPGGAHRRPD